MIYCHNFVSDVRLSIVNVHISHFDRILWMLDQPKTNFTVMAFVTSYTNIRRFILIREKHGRRGQYVFVYLMIHNNLIKTYLYQS
jgi:hypothetical protein